MPPARSMMLRRRMPSATPGRVKYPASSGPRCRIASHIARSSAAATAVSRSSPANPAIPHISGVTPHRDGLPPAADLLDARAAGGGCPCVLPPYELREREQQPEVDVQEGQMAVSPEDPGHKERQQCDLEVPELDRAVGQQRSHPAPGPLDTRQREPDHRQEED